jgi:hypothetical protein
VAKKITPTLTGETLEGSVVKCIHRGAFYYPTAVKPGCKQITWGLDGNAYYKLRYMITSTSEYSQIVHHSFFRRFWEWTNNSMIKLSYLSIHKRFSTCINIL